LIFAISLSVSPIRNASAFQFVDRILRPCGGSATGSVIVTTTNINLTPCPGGSVTINGTPIVPGAGLPDPGANGYVVRTALNTDTARTFAASLPLTVTNGSGVVGNTSYNCPTCVTSAAALTSTALMTGAGLQAAQTPAATATLLANGNISTPGSVTTGNAGGVSGAIDLSGSTSGTVTVSVAAAAGTWTLTLPTTDGGAGEFLQTDGSGVTTWAAVGGGFTCGACALDTIQKGDGAGNLLNSRITDDGTDITAQVTNGGSVKLGDYNDINNGTQLILDDTTKSVYLAADDSGSTSQLTLTGGASPSVLLAANSLVFQIDETSSTTYIPGSNVYLNGATNLSPSTNGTTDLGSLAFGLGFRQVFLDATITAGGTVGAQTIDKSAGSVNFAAGATSLVVTSNKVTASSIVTCTVATNDATFKSVQCVPAAGSFTMFASAAATAETRVQFWILNQ
jgi:hypothetical protein